MRNSAALSARHAEILQSIVHAFIHTGEPVASRTVSKTGSRSLSPATIRNIMADLSDEGYLSQPHTSAGRVPTAKAYRDYVKSLQTMRLLHSELARMRAELNQAETVEARLECGSHMLMELTRNVGIAAAIPTGRQTLYQVEFVSLAANRVLMVVVTQDRMVTNRVVVLDEPVSQDELTNIRNYINFQFSGWSFADIQRELRERLEEERAVFDQILRKLTLLFSKGLLDFGQPPSVHMEGASNLVGVDFHLTREKMRDLFRALEEKKKILHLLERFLEADPGEVKVHVGLDEIHPGMSELSLIGLTVNLPGGMRAKIAVLGPMRMNYERVVSAVLHVGEAFHGI